MNTQELINHIYECYKFCVEDNLPEEKVDYVISNMVATMAYTLKEGSEIVLDKFGILSSAGDVPDRLIIFKPTQHFNDYLNNLGQYADEKTNIVN